MHHEQTNGAEAMDSPWKGLAAGLIGGLVATWAMTQFQTFLTRLEKEGNGESGGDGGENATVRAAEAISSGVLRHELPEEKKEAAGAGVHYGFGTLMGGAYGAVAEVAPAVVAGQGFPFGAALWLGADEVAVPALGLSKRPAEIPVSKHAGALAAHLVYGAILEVVRRSVRGLLG